MWRCSDARCKNGHIKLSAYREAVAANVFVVQRHGHPHPDVGAALHRCGGHGEVLGIVSRQIHLEHAVHPLLQRGEETGECRKTGKRGKYKLQPVIKADP